MTKIKNFRITLRPREIARWLKKERGVEATPDLELMIERSIKDAARWVKPAAVYTTLPRTIAEKTTSLVFPEKSVAVSVIAVSIGPALEQEHHAAQGDSTREPLLAALEQESITQSVQFAARLILEQAKEEDCDMSNLAAAQDAPSTLALAALVGIQRIGITLDGPEPQLPRYARVACMFWTPMGKGSHRRSEPAGRTEKVAA